MRAALLGLTLAGVPQHAASRAAVRTAWHALQARLALPLLPSPTLRLRTQPEFEGAFNLPRGAPLRVHWQRIPAETDVLLTHTPPAGHLDSAWRAGSVGCGELQAAIERVRPLLSVFGHIHEAYGMEVQEWAEGGGCHCAAETIYVNAASVDLSCCPVHEPVVVDVYPRSHTPANSTGSTTLT